MSKAVEIKKGVFYDIEIRKCDEGDWGECLSATKSERGEIGVRPGLSKRNTKSTIIHEVIHAMDFEWKIGLTEEQTLQLEAAIMLLLDLNDLLPYLKKAKRWKRVAG